MFVKIIKGACQAFPLYEANHGVSRRLALLLPKGRYAFNVLDLNYSFREVSFDVGKLRQAIGSDEFIRTEAEIAVNETLEQKTGWGISKPSGLQQPKRPSAGIQEFAAEKEFAAKRKVAFSRIEKIESFSSTLKKLLGEAKICTAQCDNLVLTCLEGIDHIRETYSAVSENEMWLLHSAGKLPRLLSSLDRTLFTLESTKELVNACGTRQWGKMGLVVSIPLPPSGTKIYSKFDLLLKEFRWNADTILYLLHLTGDLDSKRSEIRGRYVPERNEGTGVEAKESERLVRQDRDHLLSNLKNGSLLTDLESSFIDLVWQRLRVKFQAHRLRESLAAVLEKRLQVEELGKLLLSSSVPDCFWIDHKDVKIGTRLAGDLKKGTKAIYRGKWFGQKVAVGIVRGIEKAAVGSEAAVMLTVQHPHTVEFLGCAFADPAPPPAWNGKRDDRCKAGYFVMELMDESLRSLIERCNHGSEGPFSVAVAVDILLQIVAAMIHVHNCNIMYRDLKSDNCLVNRRPSSSFSSSEDFYTVKLIDFETSKMLNPDDDAESNHTVMRGTCRWMAPEVWKTRPDEHLAPYEKSADVFSFGMTIYEVVTGLLPFHEFTLNTEIKAALDRGERPLVPASVTCPSALQELMRKCWDQVPSKRPDFKEIEKALWAIKCDLELE